MNETDMHPQTQPIASSQRVQSTGHRLEAAALAEHYQILFDKTGGTGVVIGVRERETGKKYAVKTLQSVYWSDLERIEQFKSEAQFWMNLQPHDHIVEAYEVKIYNHQPYLFVEYVEGDGLLSLHDWLQGGALETEQAILFAYQLCVGMADARLKVALKSAGVQDEIVHLDLTPGNVLITKELLLKITDFGLANQIRIQDGRYPRAKGGTWPYAAPEVFAEEAVDPRSDIYSAGILFYEMLTGHLPYPFRGIDRDFFSLQAFHARQGTRELATSLQQRGMSALPQGDELGLLIGRCLEPHMQDRWPSFGALVIAFENAFESMIGAYRFRRGTRARTTAKALWRQAQSLQRLGYHSDALSLYNRLLTNNPSVPQLWAEAARSMTEVGLSAYASQFYLEAERLQAKKQASG